MTCADPALDHSTPAPAPLDAPPSARALIEAQVAMLSRLAEIGMELAEGVGREARGAQADRAAEAEPAAAPARDHGLAFARVARAVRMTIALQSRLMKDLAALDRADDLAERMRAARRRMRLRGLVDDAAEAAVAAQRAAGRRFADDDAVEDEIEQLAEEAYERLTEAEDDDLTGLAFAEAAAAICNDLGLTPDWTARLTAAMGGGATPLLPTASAAGPLLPRKGGGATDPSPLAGEGGAHRSRWEGEGSHHPVRFEFSSAPPRAPP